MIFTSSIAISTEQSSDSICMVMILQLLGELLLDSQNVMVMVKYVGNVHNLILMMNLLRDQYDSIQYEAFHVFKVFLWMILPECCINLKS